MGGDKMKGKQCAVMVFLAAALCLAGCAGIRQQGITASTKTQENSLSQRNRMRVPAAIVSPALWKAADGMREALEYRRAAESVLDGWTGTYSYYQYYPPNINIDVKLNVYNSGGRYFAYLQADGFQTLERLTARIEGDWNQIDVYVYDIDPDLNSYFQEGSLLFSLKKSGGELLTKWEQMWFFEQTGQWETQFETPGEQLRAECVPVPEVEKSLYLEECGFYEDEPHCQYYDSSGTLQLELYYDEMLARGAGFRSGFTDNGFSFQGYTLETWQEPDPFAVNAGGEDGSDSVENYREFYDYDDAGHLTHYRSEGDINWLKDQPGRYTVISADFEYREDGTLRTRETRRDPNIFGSTGQWSKDWYDEAQRLVYREAYITHGSYEVYYIYRGDSRVPSYSLHLDSAGWSPYLVRYDGRQ